jgi:hypothetical protein
MSVERAGNSVLTVGVNYVVQTNSQSDTSGHSRLSPQVDIPKGKGVPFLSGRSDGMSAARQSHDVGILPLKLLDEQHAGDHTRSGGL